ncbi:MAG: corrinoid transporter substrate-binding protein [Actinotalea sp.]|nr:corrinoid transporter substrate-binding protein [Actinotalea sp.]
MPSRPSSPLRRVAATVVLSGALVLTGCSPAADDAMPSTQEASPAPAAPAGDRTAGAAEETSYPLTLDNCGVEVSVESAPERVVTIKSSTLEMMLSLGLGDRVVGAAFLDGALPGDLADQGADVTVLSDRAPGQEAVLAIEPDLVYAGWESNFSAESAGERSALAGLGVATYVSPSACKAEGYKPDPLTFDGVFEEIVEAGALFGVPEAAAELVEAQRAELAELDGEPRGVTALWYSSGDDTPYVGAGIGAPQMIMDAVGLTNIAEDVHDTWTAIGWEEVVAGDPDVIVLVDATWNTAEDKRAALQANPATAGLTAVREGRFLTVPFAATEAGVRNVAAATDLTAQLEALDLG